MKIISANFSDREEQHAKDFIENHSEDTPSTALRELVIADNEKYAHNTILSNHVKESKQLESILLIINDVTFWNDNLKKLTPENLRILESASYSLNQKCSKQLHHGTVNVR